MHIKTLKIMNSVLCVCLSMVILTTHDFWLHLIYAHAPAHTQAHMHMHTHTHTQHTHTHTTTTTTTHPQQHTTPAHTQTHTHTTTTTTTTTTHTHTHTHTQQQRHTHNTHIHDVLFSNVPHFLHTHTMWHVFFSIFPCCRTPLRAVKKMHSRIRKDLDKAIETSFQSGSYSSYAEPKTTDDKQRDVCETFNSV